MPKDSSESTALFLSSLRTCVNENHVWDVLKLGLV